MAQTRSVRASTRAASAAAGAGVGGGRRRGATPAPRGRRGRGGGGGGRGAAVAARGGEGGRAGRGRRAGEEEEEEGVAGAEYAAANSPRVRELVDLLGGMLESSREEMNEAAKRNRWIKSQMLRLFRRYARGRGDDDNANRKSELRGDHLTIEKDLKNVPRLLEEDVVEKIWGDWANVPAELKENKTRRRLNVRARRRGGLPEAAAEDDAGAGGASERRVRALMRETVIARHGARRGRRRGGADEEEDFDLSSDDEDER